jgi:3-methyladenine DNA glycosylase AlkD
MKTSSKITPKKLADEARRRLQAMADPVRAEGAQRYFKERVRFLGISTPDMRDLDRELFQKIKLEWGVAEATEFCRILLADPYYEVRGLGILIFERYRRDFPKSAFETIKGWLLADYCDSWALVDVLCPTSVGTLIESNPDLVEKIKGWAKSPNRWVRRASLVSFIKLAKKSQYLDAIYDIVRSHFGDDDDLVQKASGWLLREAGKTDQVRLEKFLRRHGPAIPRTTLRYAIERFPDSKRRALLVSTKKP